MSPNGLLIGAACCIAVMDRLDRRGDICCGSCYRGRQGGGARDLPALWRPPFMQKMFGWAQARRGTRRPNVNACGPWFAARRRHSCRA